EGAVGPSSARPAPARALWASIAQGSAMNEFEGREARVPDNFPNGTWDLRKTETGWALIRTSPPLVPADQPPPEGMPPIRLEVLDSLADDIETIDTMRSVGNVEPYGLALVGERYILEALRSLLTDGLIEA